MVFSTTLNTPDHQVFKLDANIASTSYKILDWPLSSVLLKNNACFPWFILVPRRCEITEIFQLNQNDRYQLMDELNALASFVKQYYQADKINVGALGNLVPQFHMHVVARYFIDSAWPHSVWRSDIQEKKYEEINNIVIDELIQSVRQVLSSCFNSSTQSANIYYNV